MVSLLQLPAGSEWIIIGVIVVLLFGAKKLPDLARGSARAMVEFKKASHEVRSATGNLTDELKSATNDLKNTASPAKGGTSSPNPPPATHPATDDPAS